jgi:hypothetical protein
MCSIFLIVPLLFMGCGGSDGAPGLAGLDGTDGTDGLNGVDGQDLTATATPESCATCHREAGDAHQSIYDAYTDASKFTVTIDDVSSVDNGALFNVTMLFTIKESGLPYVDGGLSALDQKRYVGMLYDNATRKFDNVITFGSPTHLGGGQYSVTALGAKYAPEVSNAAVYLYIAKNKLVSEGMQLYSDVVNVGMEFGNANTYVSAATVAGCEKCHGKPYMKHGYRAAEVAGMQDFSACKACHYDSRPGGHQAWQVLVEDPLRHAGLGTTPLTAEEKATYAYTANVMNDTHMSHAMEFPYPQSMANCATCHEGKLVATLNNANFTLQTCKSCHPVTGSVEYGTAKFALNTLWANKGLTSLHNNSLPCTTCHTAGGAREFSAMHTGYDKKIYTSTGTKYSSAFTVTIDNASFVDNTNIFTFSFHATESPDLPGLAVTDIKPTVAVGLYGWDSKDFIVDPHGSTGGFRNLEYVVGATHPRFTTVSAAGGGWTVTADLSLWAGRIADGSVKRAEIAVMPKLQVAAVADNAVLALDAPSRTFVLGSKVLQPPVADTASIVKVAGGCNACHDALATTFHATSGGRGGNIVVCRLCHNTRSGGSHLEMQSRSIDSYVHAIHSFQAFDVKNIDFTDPVEAERYDIHVEHVYPNFTILNCESCHNAGKYNVPDQSKSLPGVLSASNDNIIGWNRKIDSVPSYVVGPASRACGACHRAEKIKEDDAIGLAAFNSHTSKPNGYFYEGGSAALDEVINEIMNYWEDGIVLAH